MHEEIYGTREDYKKHIVSDDANLTFLHRCFRDSLVGILKEGLGFSGDEINGTATMQPKDIESAEGLYRAGKDHGDSVAVVKIPRSLYGGGDGKSKGSIMRKELIYFHPKKGKFTVRPEFVIAWIDRNNDEAYENPFYDRQPVEGHEEFDFMFEGTR